MQLMSSFLRGGECSAVIGKRSCLSPVCVYTRSDPNGSYYPHITVQFVYFEMPRQSNAINEFFLRGGEC